MRRMIFVPILIFLALAATLSAAVVLSLLVALLLVPLAAAHWMRGNRSWAAKSRLASAYAHILAPALRRPCAAQS